MGIGSLSHLGVVALVIAVMAVAWKLQQRRAPGRSAQFAGAPSPAWEKFLKAAVLLALFSGAMVPVFRTDGAAPLVHLIATICLTVLAGLWLFRKGGK